VIALALLTLLGGTSPGTPPVVRKDTLLASAEEALARGNPWRAYRLVVPRTRVQRTRTPETVWLAARAAAGWGGWPQVKSLLGRERWLDSKYAGGGRELMARASLALGEDSAAIVHATRAVRKAPNDSTRGVRRVLLARALDRQGRLEEAAEAYAAAAEDLPDLSDWLHLRAATAAPDLDAWAAQLVALKSPTVLKRAPASLAIAFSGRQQWTMARDAWLVAGDSVEALLVESRISKDPVLRPRFLVALRTARTDQLPRVLAAFDATFAPLTPDEELEMARAAVKTGDTKRSLDGYRRAFAAGLGTPNDRLSNASMLLRAGKPRDAAAAFAALEGPEALLARAQYDRARALFRLGQGDSARATLLAIPERFPAESSSANALALMADLTVDAGNDSLARILWLRLATVQPQSRFTPMARFQAALVAYVAGDVVTAAREFDALSAAPGPETNAAYYWAGRSWLASGDTVQATARWRAVVARSPETYYAGLAGRRLGLVPWAPSGSPRLQVTTLHAVAFVRRVQQLETCGMMQEANWEVDAWSTALESADELLDGARALAAVGRAAPAARMARRALAAGPVDSVTAYYIIYPVLHADVLAFQADEHRLDPAFSSGLIRQESTFDPEAVSGAGARGLMQVMPEVGRGLSRRLAWPLWDPVLLFQPDVSLELGHYHLANLFDRYRSGVRVLAAYNAGGAKLPGWLTRKGSEDEEVFIERIPYAETRDYVRIVLRNAEFYRRMYAWDCGPTPEVKPEDRVAATGVKVLRCG
jgi:soluble lytic murein transglycosylase